MRMCKICERGFCKPYSLRRHYVKFHPRVPTPKLERQARGTLRQQKHRKMDSPQRTIHLGDNVFAQKMLDGFLIKQSLSPDTSRIVVSLGASEFKRLLIFSDVILDMLRKRPEQAKTLAEYETLFQNQTKFLLGKNIYVKVSHIEKESLLHFVNYVMLNSMTVRGESVVCPERFLLGLNSNQFQELLKINNETMETECTASVTSHSRKPTSISMDKSYSLPPKKRGRIIKPSCKTNAQKSVEQEIQEFPVLISNRDTK